MACHAMHHGQARREYTYIPPGPVFNPGKFGRMFPELPALDVPDVALEALGAAMIDQNDALSDDNPDVPAGHTYLGQFVDHDLTFDTTTIPEVIVDPQAVFNFRTPKLELDSVYGAGPAIDRYFYLPNDDALLTLGATQRGGGDPSVPPGFRNDLPRFNGIAVIGDPRNDENLAVAQTHVAFLKFHNKTVEKLRAEGVGEDAVFEEARRLVTWHYQRIVLDDLLGAIIDQAELEDVLENGRRFYHFDPEPFMPVEFSVAAFRLGHSMVRNTYDFNRVFRAGGVVPASLELLFKFTQLSGDTVPVPSDWIIDWRRFFDFGQAAVGVNATRKLDPFLATALHDLPGGGGSLPERNLRRGVRMGLPSGQAVAMRMEFTPLDPADIASGPDGQVAAQHGLDQQTPLWYYILKEAHLTQNGERLGKVGSRILAEVFVGMLEGDPNSFRVQAPEFAPSLFKPGVQPARPGKYTMVDMLTFVDDINPLGD